MKKNSNNFIIGVIAIAVIVLLVVLLKPKADNIKEPISNVTPDTTQPNTAKNFESLMPEEWKRYKNANADIQSLNENQRIEFGIVSDPTQDNIVYFSTSAYNEETKETLLSIYKYNESDYTFERIFKHSYQEKFPGLELPWGPVLRVLGYDSGSLVVLVQDADDSAGPCTMPLIYTNDKQHGIFTMDLSDPYSGFSLYTIPDDIRTQTEAEINTCLNNL